MQKWIAYLRNDDDSGLELFVTFDAPDRLDALRQLWMPTE